MFGRIMDSNKPLPRCPFCEAKFKDPIKYSIGFKEKMYACPNCLKVLGFSKYDD